MIPTINVEETGLRIDVLIHDSEYSIKDISELLGLGTSQAIYKWINGKYLPSLDHLVALAGILDVSIDDILVIE